MKRSTLTLSILTALLVSACGGSSSNDEQTKDPTPPKVTPTNPTTPSTGKTPTTGKTEPKKEKPADSSEPNIQISSGSAPSGGKPVVIAGEPKKEIKPDDQKPENPEEEGKEEKKEDTQPSSSLAAAKEKLGAAEQEKKDAEDKVESLKPLVTRRQSEADGLADEAKAKITDGTVTADDPVEKVLTKAEGLTDPTKKQAALDAYDKYLQAQEAADKKQEELETAEANAKKAAEKVRTETKAVNLSEIDDKWQGKPAVKSVTDIVTALKAQVEANDEDKKFTDEAAALTTRKNELTGTGTDKPKEKLTAEIGVLKGLLETAKEDSTKEKIQAVIDKKQAKLDAVDKELGEIAERQKYITFDQQKAAKKKEDAQTAVTEAQKAAVNLGVAGGKDLSDDVFTGVQKAVNEDGVWKITFDAGEKASEITVNPAVWADSKNIGTDAAYGKFGSIGKDAAAYKTPKSAADSVSIYGYFGDKFYSVGQFATPEMIEKVGPKTLGFTGTSLLRDKDGKNMVSNVTGSVSFIAKEKGFTGNFNTFQTYNDKDGKLTPVDAKVLPQHIDFQADIKGNTFKPADGSPVNVYGYFYGKDGVKEAGGLVEHKDFHGSFGGEVK